MPARLRQINTFYKRRKYCPVVVCHKNIMYIHLLYQMACVLSQYNARSDWLTLLHYFYFYKVHVGKIVKHHTRLKKIEIEIKRLIHNNFKILNTKKKIKLFT